MVTYLNPGVLEFDAVVERSDNRGSSAWVEIPGDIRQLFGTTGRVPVTATFDGIDYRGSIARMGGPPLVIVLQEILAQLHKAPGDTLHVTVELDETPRVVELAHDIEAGLVAAGQLDAYRSLAYSHQRQFVLWIDGAKRPRTAARRSSGAFSWHAARTRWVRINPTRCSSEQSTQPERCSVMSENASSLSSRWRYSSSSAFALSQPQSVISRS